MMVLAVASVALIIAGIVMWVQRNDPNVFMVGLGISTVPYTYFAWRLLVWQLRCMFRCLCCCSICCCYDLIPSWPSSRDSDKTTHVVLVTQRDTTGNNGASDDEEEAGSYGIFAHTADMGVFVPAAGGEEGGFASTYDDTAIHVGLSKWSLAGWAGGDADSGAEAFYSPAPDMGVFNSEN